MAGHAPRRKGALCSAALGGYDYVAQTGVRGITCKQCLDIMASHHPDTEVVKINSHRWELRKKGEVR